MTMLDQRRIRELIPHAGRMCLLDTVEQWDESSVHCTSRTHLDAQNPLRGAQGLLSLHLAEYAAQATAVHGGLRAGPDAKPAPGMLVSLRAVTLNVQTLDGVAAPLSIEARLRLTDAAGWLYDFRVSADGAELAAGRLMVMTATSD